MLSNRWNYISHCLARWSRALAQRRRKCFDAHPWYWGSVGLRPCAWLPVGYALIPTKTSRFWNQFTGSVPLCFRSFFQVHFASLVNWWSLFVCCAVMRSMVNCSFIAQCHLVLIPCLSRFRMVALDFGVGRGLVYSVLVDMSFREGEQVVYLFSLAISHQENQKKT